ncbi:hypothetical protein AA11237_3101 [Acidocella aminolytica 101 = DSM 11237]|nr:hypothetical protein AA11237_3101 [Acidocella aminolytica 101 = DSM 11237]
MDILPGNQLAKIDCVLGHDHPVLGDAAHEDNMVRIAQATNISWMCRVVDSRSVEMLGELG